LQEQYDADFICDKEVSHFSFPSLPIETEPKGGSKEVILIIDQNQLNGANVIILSPHTVISKVRMYYMYVCRYRGS